MFKLWIFLLAASPLFAAYPPPQGRINDFAGILTPADKAKVLTVINEVETTTSAEIFVVTLPSLDGKPLELYANQLFNQWGIGKKGKNNGLLVLISLKERKIRIEVGYGLESTIPDGLAGDIIRDDLAPSFKKENYGAGILQAVTRISKFIEGSESAKEWMGKNKADRDFWLHVQVLCFLGLFVIIGSLFLGCGLGSKTFFFLIMGSFFEAIPMIGVYFTSQFNSLDRLILDGITLFFLFIGFLLGRKFTKALRKAKKKKKGVSAGGWTWGASTGSGSGSSGGGGGGGSGGGGASGGW